MKKQLKKLMAFAVITSTVLSFNVVPIAANNGTPERVIGKTGFFGGITEGRELPNTTDILMQDNGRRTQTTTENFTYRRVVFINGISTEIEGLLRITTRGGVTDAPFGTYRVTHHISSPNGNAAGDRITSNLDLDVHWRRDGNQIVRNFSVRSWSEVIRVNGQNYTLRPNQSHFSVSSLEDVRPGATYFRGTVNVQAVYFNANRPITIISEGHIYGFNTVWSNAESNIMTTTIMRDDWQMQVETRSSVSVNKTLQFTPTQPTYISFAGNYVEIMQNRSFLTYDVIVYPQHFSGMPTRGTAYIRAFNRHEHLVSRDTSVWRGHFAEANINQLFAMDILRGDPRFFVPGDAITRSEFVQMLVRSIKLPLVPVPTQTGTARNPVQINIVFPDVMHDRPDFPYVMAAYNARLALGRGNGHFEPDSRLTREEVITLMVRALGLTNLGSGVITPFSDNYYISPWAMESVDAAVRLGLVAPDSYGYIHPQQIVTKAEAAAWIVRFIEYMRHDLQADYTEHLLFFF